MVSAGIPVGRRPEIRPFGADSGQSPNSLPPAIVR